MNNNVFAAVMRVGGGAARSILPVYNPAESSHSRKWAMRRRSNSGTGANQERAADRAGIFYNPAFGHPWANLARISVRPARLK